MNIVYSAINITNGGEELIFSSNDLTSVYIKAMEYLSLETHKNPLLSAIQKDFKRIINGEYVITNNGMSVKITKNAL